MIAKAALILFWGISVNCLADKPTNYTSHLNCQSRGKKDSKLPHQVSLFPDENILSSGEEGEFKNGVVVLEGDNNPDLNRWTLGSLIQNGKGIAEVSYVVPLGLGHQRRVTLTWATGESIDSHGYKISYRQKTEARNPQLKSESQHDLICQLFATSFQSVSGQ